MPRRSNTLPTYDETNATPGANQPTLSRYPPPLGHYMASDSASGSITQNHNYCSNDNLSTVEANNCPPPYTSNPLSNQLPNHIPHSLYGDRLDDPTYKEMILIMGMRGGGKSYFINQMVGGDVATMGDGIARCTLTCQAVPTRLGRSKVILIDTPGFDEVNSSRAVCAEICRVLVQLYQRGVSLRGFIYMQRITEKKTIGSAASVLKLFRSLCGETKLLKNTILVTTGWQLPHVDETQGVVQERELRKFWGQMLHQGSTMVRYYGDRGSGVGIISQILGNEDLPFETEAELITRGRQLEERVKIVNELARLQQELDNMTLTW